VRKLWGLARHIKDAWEWWSIISTLPVATLVIAAVKGLPLDVVLLYLMVAVAYFVVIVSEYPAVGEFIFARKRSAVMRRCEALGRFLIQGQDLAHKLAGGYGASRVTELGLLEEINEWARRVENYLDGDRAFGASYVARFRQDGILPVGVVSAENLPWWLRDWENAVQARCQKLETFITEIRP